MAAKTVTVTNTVARGLPRFTVQFSMLPDRTFGPWNFTQTVRDLTISALLTPMAARNLVLDAHAHGKASAACDY
jgi:hypothetical protein